MESEESFLEEKLLGNVEDSPTPEIEVHNTNVGFKCRITIEPVVFAFFFAISLSDSVIMNFIMIRTCEIHFNFNKSICSQLGNGNQSNLEATIQPYSAMILTEMNFLSILLPAIMSFFLGPWSDYNGRKLVLVIPALGYCAKYILLGIFSFLPNLGPEYGLVAVIPVALSGGVINFITAAYAYASDISQEDTRSFRIILLESVIYSGSNIGLLSASYIYEAGGSYGFALIYGLCAIIIISATIPTYFFVPESVQIIERGKKFWHVFELKLFKDMLKVCFAKREGCKRAVIFLVIAALTITLAIDGGEGNVIYFFTRLRFGWDIREFTLWASVLIALAFFGVICGSIIFSKWLKVPDAIVGALSYSLKAANAFYIAFIPSNAPHLMFYSGLINIFGGLSCPMGRTILSKSVPKEDIGKVFALASSSESVFPLATGPIYTALYNSTINTLPSAFFFVSGALCILCCIFFIIIHFIQKLRSQEE